MRAGVDWRPGVVGQLILSIEEDTATAYALEADEPVISTDLAKEERFKIADFLIDHGVKALVNVPIPGPTGQPPYGILEVDSREPRRFTEHDTDFLRTYANLLTAAIERIHSLHALRTTVADKERLLRELQHRVRNNLQMIIGLVRLQERRVQSRGARSELLSIARLADNRGCRPQLLALIAPRAI